MKVETLFLIDLIAMAFTGALLVLANSDRVWEWLFDRRDAYRHWRFRRAIHRLNTPAVRVGQSAEEAAESIKRFADGMDRAALSLGIER